MALLTCKHVSHTAEKVDEILGALGFCLTILKHFCIHNFYNLVYVHLTSLNYVFFFFFCCYFVFVFHEVQCFVDITSTKSSLSYTKD